jgi:hypothetical protein
MSAAPWRASTAWTSSRAADLRHVGDPQQILDAAEFLELTLVQHRDPVAHVLDVGQQVRGHDHGLSSPLQVDDQVLHLPGADRVEAAGRLVEEHEFGVVDQRLGHADPSRHALRILLQLPLLVAAEPDHFDECVRPPPALLGRHVEQPAVEVERLLGVEELVEVRLLGQVADPLVLRDVGRPAAEDERLARGGKDEPQQELHRGRLAGPVGPEQAEDLAPADLEVERLERHLLAATPEVAVGLREVAGFDDDVGASGTLARRGGLGHGCGSRRGHGEGVAPRLDSFVTHAAPMCRGGGSGGRIGRGPGRRGNDARNQTLTDRRIPLYSCC